MLFRLQWRVILGGEVGITLERADVETIVKATLAGYHVENVQRMARIEERIIAIDGNGTGRVGAVQRLEMGMANILEQIEGMRDSITNVKVDVGGSLKTKTMIGIAGSIGVVILGAFASITAGWIEHKLGWK